MAKNSTLKSLIVGILATVLGTGAFMAIYNKYGKKDEHAHEWAESELTQAATCTENGILTYTCTCGETQTEAIPATGHTWADGSCVVCETAGYTITFANLPEDAALDSVTLSADEWDVYVLPAVPAKEGYTGEWDAALPTTPADTTVNAVYTLASYTITVDLLVLGENYGTKSINYTMETRDEILKPVTDMADELNAQNDGYTYTFIDVDTGEVLPDVLPLRDCNYVLIKTAETEHVHDFASETITQAATCTENGILTYTCSCGETQTEAIPATGHTEDTIPAVAATCAATGLTEGVYCIQCGEVFTAQEKIPALGHSFENETCTVCGCDYSESAILENIAIGKQSYTESAMYDQITYTPLIEFSPGNYYKVSTSYFTSGETYVGLTAKSGINLVYYVATDGMIICNVGYSENVGVVDVAFPSVLSDDNAFVYFYIPEDSTFDGVVNGAFASVSEIYLLTLSDAQEVSEASTLSVATADTAVATVDMLEGIEITAKEDDDDNWTDIY